MRLKEEIEIEIEKILEILRPALKEDLGGVELVRFDETSNVCEVKPIGNCNGCPLWMMTLRAGIERYLIKYIPEIRRVESV